MTTHSILIVEDEKDIRRMLAFGLTREGFAVHEAAGGDTGLAKARELRPDAILLDIMLPGMDGLEVCRQLQRDAALAHIPVIFLTAKGEETDRIVGLELGAVDYVVKPFSLREVALRVRTALRRKEDPPPPSLLCDGLALDRIAHTVTADGAPVALTVTEFRVLEDLLLHSGQVRSREQLLDSVWGMSFEGYARGVDSHIKRLRAKLGPAGECIETVRGVGYCVRSRS